MERTGINLDSCALKYQFVNGSRGPFNFDAVAYVISLNIRRRHLTKQQQADRIVAAYQAAGNKPPQGEEVSRGGRGNVNEKKAAIVAAAAEHGISKATVERAIAARRATHEEQARKRRETAEEKRAYREEQKAERERETREAMEILDTLPLASALRLVEILLNNNSIHCDVLLALQKIESSIEYAVADEVDAIEDESVPRDATDADDDLGDIPACLDRRRR
jgi:hypothetical protein